MEKIINQVQPGWSKDLIIRYLYIKLAPLFQRDLQYFMVDAEEKEKQFKQGFINRVPLVVCSTLADVYVQVFQDFGIEAKKVIANSAKIPLFAVLVHGNLGWYFLDPLNDLFSNQYGIRPDFFAIIPRYNTIRTHHPELTKLPHEYISEIDTTLKIHFLNEYFEYLHQKLVQKKEAKRFFGIPIEEQVDVKERKIQFYNDKLINLGNVHGTFERAQLYKYLNDRILNHGEKRFVCVRIEDWQQNPHVSYEIRDRNRHIFYEEEKTTQGEYTLTKKYTTTNL